MNNEKKDMYDVIIIGKGPAGISAALYTVRANLSTLVLGGDASSLNKAEKIENYFGFENVIKGSDLLVAGEKQAVRIGANIVNTEVIGFEPEGDVFKVFTADQTYKSKALLIATGQERKKVVIPGLADFEGNGVSYCTTCDGFFYRGLNVGILGSGDYALHEAEEMKAFTDKITIFTDGKELSAKKSEKTSGLSFNEKKIKKFVGKDALSGIEFEDGTTQDIDGIFIAGESASGVDFARKVGVMFEGNSIVVDKEQKTNIKGLFAAGDCTGGFKQISVAVGQGAMAGRMIIEYLRENVSR